jgi:L-lactate utilization protein LutB
MGEDIQKFIVHSLEETRKAVMENLAEMRELKGEVKEFKEHVLGRVEKLERKEGERNGFIAKVLSLLISTAALAVSIMVNFFRNGGK